VALHECIDQLRTHTDRQTFEADLARSRRSTLADWQERPLTERLAEHAASLGGAQL